MKKQQNKRTGKNISCFYLFSVKGEFYQNLFNNVSLADTIVKSKYIMR